MTAAWTAALTLHVAFQVLPWLCEQMLLVLLLDIYFLIKVKVFPTCLLCSVGFPTVWTNVLKEATSFLYWRQLQVQGPSWSLLLGNV